MDDSATLTIPTVKTGLGRAAQAYTPANAEFSAMMLTRVTASHAAIRARIAISAAVRASLAVVAVSVRCRAGLLR
jgi:hypothetical protein